MDKYTFHTDPGHVWLEVSRVELVELGINDKISPYSYQCMDKVYLEEDCDYAVFFDAKAERGEVIEYVESYKDNTPIRRYAPFNPKALPTHSVVRG